MTPRHLIIDILIFSGVAVELICCLGVLAMRNVYARLHCLGPAAILGPWLIALAILLDKSVPSNGIMAILTALALMGTGPILSHATARAARVRQFGDLRLQPGERVENG